MSKNTKVILSRKSARSILLYLQDHIDDLRRQGEGEGWIELVEIERLTLKSQLSEAEFRAKNKKKAKAQEWNEGEEVMTG